MEEFITSDEEQSSFLEYCEKFFANHKYLGSQFHNIIQLLYKQDLLSNKVILSWADNAQASLDTHNSKKDADNKNEK